MTYRHHGRHGAAGVLLHFDGYVLLEKRSPWVDNPGTWGVPGGALHEREHPFDAAWREVREELHAEDLLLFAPPRPAGAVERRCPSCPWAYWTFVVNAAGRDLVRVHRSHGESDEARWFWRGDVAHLRHLHPGLASAWPDLLRLVRRQR